MLVQGTRTFVTKERLLSMENYSLFKAKNT